MYSNIKRILLLVIFFIISAGLSAQSWNPGHYIGTVTGKYSFVPGQIPDQLTEVQPAAIPNTGLAFQWQSSQAFGGPFSDIPGATGSSCSFSSSLSNTMYYRRKTTHGTLGILYSNIVKLSLVSSGWEDLNYIREHDIMTAGITTWEEVDQLTIGEKLQTTTYMDGLGRKIQAVSRGTATPASGSLWGDRVSFARYDALGREPLKYLPYTTTALSGKYKTSTTGQADYYSDTYSETSPFYSVTFDNSPLNRVTGVKQPGAAWAAGTGNVAYYGINDSTEEVRIFGTDYTAGNPPVYKGLYAANTLYKNVYTDVNSRQVVEYSNKSGQLILRKVQIDDSPSAAHSGWICTYYVYDDKGLLHCQLQPEAVKYLDTNSWSFAGTDGTRVLNEYCFLYSYDDKGRMVWKKAPGAQPLRMLYDIRDRLVLTQDGNQAALSPAQWTGTLYDELDRPVISFLYNTTKSAATLQNDINAAPASVTAINITHIGNTGGGSISIAVNYSPVVAADCNNAAVITVLRYSFYDDYTYPGAKTFNSGYTNTTAYSSSDPDVMPIAATQRVTGMLTGYRTRVLGSSTFLSGTSYYDERGSLIQTLEDNIKSGADITTTQYHFDGRVLSTCTDHTADGTDYTHFKTLTKNVYDKIGRVSSVEKKYGSNAFKVISSYAYDDAGRLKNKKLDPAYTAGGNAQLESLNYSYNLHNQVTGINKDYALKEAGVYNKWDHFFGLYLGYDNKDGTFAKAELNGQVTGLLWNTQGDDAQRKYDYLYDHAGRLTNAGFEEQLHPGDGFDNAKMDFSVGGDGGRITYDLNGNLLKMLHKGVLPGTAAPVTIDDLSYTYTLSNKLDKVTDAMPLSARNGRFGDFKDGANGSSEDYIYDDNGNVVADLNKSIQDAGGNGAGTPGVLYNFLDKPELVRITGKGTVRIVYSADGNVLQRAFIPETGTSSITTTINEFVYRETSTTLTASTAAPFSGTGLSLSSILFEEGRIRVITPTSTGNGFDALTVSGNLTLPGSKEGVYDYYIRDYQENVRMILTEENYTAYNTATMETGRASLETPVFGQTGSANEVTATRYATPPGWSNNSSASVSRLGNLAGYTIGPNTLQKVMAGDKISAQVSYYFAGAPGGGSSGMLTNVLGSLIAAVSGGDATGGMVKDGASGIHTALGNTPGFVNAVSPAGDVSAPQAYLTMMFFDERFNFISAADGGVAQLQVDAAWSTSTLPLVLAAVKAPKNGYVYVYISNRSDQHVYFDDFKVSLQAGNIIEENHYYAFGLKIAAISSKKLGNTAEGVLQNNYLYQGTFAEFDEDTEWHDFVLRNYDAQIGRWTQQDPYQQFPSPYTSMGGDPVNNIDPSGGVTLPYFALTKTTGVISGASQVTGIMSKTVTTFSIVSNATTIVFTAASAAMTIINGNSTTEQVGDLTKGENLNILDDGMISNSRIIQNRITKLEKSRISQEIKAIILHRTVSSNTSSTLNSFKTRGVGTHFLIGKDGKILQTASMNSSTSHLRESQIKKGMNLKNNNTIGIEVVGNYNDATKIWEPLTEEQIESTSFLVNSLTLTYSLTEIYSHESVQPKTAGEGGTVCTAISPFLKTQSAVDATSPIKWHPPMLPTSNIMDSTNSPFLFSAKTISNKF